MTAVSTIAPQTWRASSSLAAPSGVRGTLAAVSCAKILTAGARDAAREWRRHARQRRHDGVQGLAAIMLCRSPADLVAAQADMVSGRLDLIRQTSERLSEIVGATAGDAVRALSADDAR